MNEINNVEFETSHGTRYAFLNRNTREWQCIGSNMHAPTINQLRPLVEKEFNSPGVVSRDGIHGYSEACGVWD